VIGDLAAGATADAGSIDVVVDASTVNPNTATVTGNDPADPNGPALTDADDSSFTFGTPALEIRKTIVEGPGGTCPATFALAADGDDSIASNVGETVTYCFWVANTGTGPTTDVTVDDAEVGFAGTLIAELAAGATANAGSIDVVIDATTANPNTATVTGNDPATVGGPQLTDEDDSSFTVGAPILEIRKTIVEGPNGSCPVDFASAIDGLDTIPTTAGLTVSGLPTPAPVQPSTWLSTTPRLVSLVRTLVTSPLAQRPMQVQSMFWSTPPR